MNPKTRSDRSSNLVSVAHHVVDSDQTFEDHDPVWVLHPLEEQVRQVRDRHIRLLGAAEQIWKMHISNWRSNVALKRPSHSQSRCFLLGAMSSSVVALHTALARPWPAMECLAARMRSLIVWPLAISETVCGEGRRRRLFPPASGVVGGSAIRALLGLPPLSVGRAAGRRKPFSHRGWRCESGLGGGEERGLRGDTRV